MLHAAGWPPEGAARRPRSRTPSAAALLPSLCPKKFTQWQIFAYLVLKVRLRLDYRGVWQFLLDSTDLRQSIGLTRVPHWTTLQKNAEPDA
jgi:hypothetical protein